jgi:hypothetical protein
LRFYASRIDDAVASELNDNNKIYGRPKNYLAQLQISDLTFFY